MALDRQVQHQLLEITLNQISLLKVLVYLEQQRLQQVHLHSVLLVRFLLSLP